MEGKETGVDMNSVESDERQHPNGGITYPLQNSEEKTNMDTQSNSSLSDSLDSNSDMSGSKSAKPSRLPVKQDIKAKQVDRGIKGQQSGTKGQATSSTVTEEQSCPEKIKSPAKLKKDFIQSSDEFFVIPGGPQIRETVTSRMRYEKGHSIHDQECNAEEYMTPTQRKGQQVKEMKVQIKELSKALEDRDLQIEQLRDSVGKETASVLECKNREILKVQEELRAVEEKFQALTNSYGESVKTVNILEETVRDLKLRESVGKETASVLECKNREILKVQEELRAVEEKFQALTNSYGESVKTVNILKETVRDLKETMDDREQKHENIYLEMYRKGQHAAQFEREEELVQLSKGSNPSISYKELLHKLIITEAELAKWQSLRRQESYEEAEKPETEAAATLRFLRDSFFHYLIDQRDSDDHLRAMIRIFQYTEVQKKKISKALIAKSKK